MGLLDRFRGLLSLPALLSILAASALNYAVSRWLFDADYVHLLDRLIIERGLERYNILRIDYAKLRKMARVWPPHESPFLTLGYTASLYLLLTKCVVSQAESSIRPFLRGSKTFLAQSHSTRFINALVVAIFIFSVLLPLERMASRLASRGSLLVQTRGKAKGVTIKNPSADFLPFKGVPAVNKPFRVELEAGKVYKYDASGLSKTQPFDDGTHYLPGYTDTRQIEFTVEKSGTYALCGCKQTNTRPLCDGSHKQVSGRPRSADASRFVAFGKSPVYDGVAHSLGHKTKNEGFF